MLTTTIKRSGKFFGMISLILGVFACETKDIIPYVQNFKIFDVAPKAVLKTKDQFLILSDSVWFSINFSGEPSPYHSISVFPQKDKFYSSEILSLNDDVYVLGSVYSENGEYVDLGIVHTDLSGNIINKTRVQISDGFLARDLNKENSNFTITAPLYAKGVILPSAEMIVAFNLIGKQGELWKYSLLHLDKELKVVNRRDYNIRNFYGWIYKIIQYDDEKFLMTRGGNNWFSIDQFDVSLNVNSFIKNVKPDSLANPMITGIQTLPNGKFIMTGHIDLVNNPVNSLYTNFDYWILKYDLTNHIESEFAHGFLSSKELCFDAIIEENEDALLAGGQRGFNQTTFDLTAKIRLLETNTSTQESQETLVSEAGGMEAFAIHKRPDGTLDIIGRKFGYSENQVQTFYKTINPN